MRASEQAENKNLEVAAISRGLKLLARDLQVPEVLDALQRYRLHHGMAPTAYELLRWMQIEHPALDLNAVRPRLTELKDAGRVSTSGKRRCAVTDKRVYTWAIVSPAPHPIPYHDQPRQTAAVQEVLF